MLASELESESAPESELVAESESAPVLESVAAVESELESVAAVAVAAVESESAQVSDPDLPNRGFLLYQRAREIPKIARYARRFELCLRLDVLVRLVTDTPFQPANSAQSFALKMFPIIESVFSVGRKLLRLPKVLRCIEIEEFLDVRR